MNSEEKEFPFVSIVVCSYNAEKKIEATINSLLNLNYPKNKYEIIKKAPENNYLIERYYSLFKKSIYSNLSVPNL